MSNENELLEPLATEAGQQAIVRAIRDMSSLEYAVRAERAATNAAQSADEALNSANDASDSEEMARKWATKTDGAVAQETIEIPPEQEGDDPTTETINLYSARYYAALAEQAYDNLQFDSVPTQDSTNLVSSGAVYDALDLKADKSTTYTKTEVDSALGNVQSALTFDNAPTANSDNPVKSGGIYTALSSKADSSSVPTKVSDLTNDSGFITGVAWNDVTSKPTFATVATSGSYNDLSNTPTIPTVPTKVSDLTNDTGFITGVSWSDVTSKPTFATVATSGSYSDLTDKPTIPSAYTLPTASANTLGGIKVGTNLSIDNDGVLSASGGGSSITIDSSITENSQNPVTSAAIYSALQNIGTGGGSGTNIGITRTTLYDGYASGTGQGSGILQLSDSIDNYDFIEFRIAGNLTNFRQQIIPKFISKQQLLETLDTETGASVQNMFLVAQYGTRWCSLRLDSADHSKITVADVNDTYIRQVWGLKFNSYVSGVTVDSIVTQNSSNVVSSGAVYTAIQNAINNITNANGVSY